MQIQGTQASVKFPTPNHLITDLEYRLKPHHQRRQFRRARLDTCVDVNIMPASVYKIVFQDPDCKKLAPGSKLEIGTHTINKVKAVGSCVLYAVHPYTQCLQEVTFFVACNNGSVVLSHATMLALSLIQPHTSLDYLPSCASLIASSADHPMKTKSQIDVQVSKTDYRVCTEFNKQGMKPKLITSNNKSTHASKHPVVASSQPGMRTSTDKKTHVSMQKATESSQQSLRSKPNTSTDHNTKMSKQEALISKLITSEGTQLQKLYVHQIAKQSSTRSEVQM